MTYELLISDPTTGAGYIPAVQESIELNLERRSTPGKLTFKVIRDNILKISEGNAVSLKVDGKGIFYGFVFTQKSDRDGIITVTCYDQLRYLKNKDTYNYSNKTASQVLKMIANDYSLSVGAIEDTNYVIGDNVEDNTSLFDIIENALDETLVNTKEMFVMYDDFGKITLKNISSMLVGDNGNYLLIDSGTGENYDYTSSIDTDTYNQIKLVRTNEEGSIREVYISKDSSNINKWGVLQYFEEISGDETETQIKEKADSLLKLYNSQTRNLKITNVFGDTRVRAGSMVMVQLNLGDINVSSFMLVEKVKHTFGNDSHLMDLTLRGGEFIA